MHDILHPVQTTYFICYDSITDTDPAYGVINTDQELTSGRSNIWTSLVEQDWLDELKNTWNIVPE